MAQTLEEQADSPAAFLKAYAGIYEHAPWVAERAFARGARFGNPEAIHGLMKRSVDEASYSEKLALLRAHPDLGVASIAPLALTASSKEEQAAAGLASCTAAQIETLSALNAAYRAKFGFPFILAVKGRQRDEILAIFSRCLEEKPESEFMRALSEVHKIAWLRLTNHPSTDRGK